MRRAEALHMRRVAELPCVLCGSPCARGVNRGPSGIHGDRSLMRIQKLDELDLLALTIEALSK